MYLAIKVKSPLILCLFNPIVLKTLWRELYCFMEKIHTIFIILRVGKLWIYVVYSKD